VLATLGNQGVVAVRNAELYDNNQRSIWELKNLQEALQAATSTLDLNQVLQQVLAGAAKASSAQIGCLALEESGKLVLKGGFGTDSSTAEKLALGVGGDICRDVMASGKPFMEAMERDTITESPLNPRAVLCVPITLRGTPTGVLFLVLVLCTVNGFLMLDLIYILTMGGPGYDTTTISWLGFQTTFKFFKFGPGTAILYTLTGLCLLMTLLYHRLILSGFEAEA